MSWGAASLLVACVTLAAGAAAAQEVRIDSECKPSYFNRGRHAASPTAKREFWTEQKVAINAKVEAEFAARRARAIEKQADDQIAAIEARRDAALGLPQKVDAQANAELRRIDREMAAIDARMLAATLDWAKRCLLVADQQIAQANEALLQK